MNAVTPDIRYAARPVPEAARVRKVIFLNRFFYPDHSATSQLLTDVATALAGKGLCVEVIASRLRYDAPEQRLPHAEIVRGVEVVRVTTTGFGRGNLVGRALDYLTFYVSAAYRVFRRARRGDVIVVKTDPPMLSIAIAPVAWLRGARYANWLQDLFPEVAEAIAPRGGRPWMLSFAMVKRLRDVTLRNAGMNIVLGERMARCVAARGVEARRIRIIPNWADGRLIRRIASENNRLRREWNLAESFVVGYSGNLGRAHEIGTLLNAIALLEDRMATIPATPGEQVLPAIRWLFIGGGALSLQLRARAERRGLASVMFQPYQHRDMLSESLSVADVHLISLRPELEGFIVPSKYYGIAAVGRPAIFIGDAEGEIARVLKRSETGTVVAEGDSAGLARAVVTYARDATLRHAQGARARHLFETEFDSIHALDAWERAIGELLTSR